MNPNTQIMEEVCNGWSGRFANAMKIVAQHCAEYDDAFRSINLSLADTASEWQKASAHTTDDAAKQHEEHEHGKRMSNEQWHSLISRKNELRQKTGLISDKLIKYTGKTLGQIRQERKKTPSDNNSDEPTST